MTENGNIRTISGDLADIPSVDLLVNFIADALLRLSLSSYLIMVSTQIIETTSKGEEKECRCRHRGQRRPEAASVS